VSVVAGCDEAGRGALAGPVVAAAVVLDYNSINPYLLTDSKVLTAAKRDEAYRMLRASDSVIGFSIINHKVVDDINVLQASLLAMARSVSYLRCDFDEVIVDGNRCPAIEGVPVSCLVKGDSKIPEISAASIVAKVIRDRLMCKYHRYFQGYAFDKNKGYGSKAHYDAVFEQGLSKIHRKSFSIKRQLTLF